MYLLPVTVMLPETFSVENHNEGGDAIEEVRYVCSSVQQFIYYQIKCFFKEETMKKSRFLLLSLLLVLGLIVVACGGTAPQPAAPAQEAIVKTARWYQANEWWWRKIKSGEFRAYYQAQYGQRLQESES